MVVQEELEGLCVCVRRGGGFWKRLGSLQVFSASHFASLLSSASLLVELHVPCALMFDLLVHSVNILLSLKCFPAYS